MCSLKLVPSLAFSGTWLLPYPSLPLTAFLAPATGSIETPFIRFFYKIRMLLQAAGISQTYYSHTPWHGLTPLAALSSLKSSFLLASAFNVLSKALSYSVSSQFSLTQTLHLHALNGGAP